MNRRDEKLLLRGSIITLHQQGLSSRVIARDLGLSRTTVTKWIKRYEESGNLDDLRKYKRSSVY